MKQLSPDQIKKLKEPLPPGAVKPHPTKSYLSSIKAIYEVERLNDVFGIGSWNLASEIVDNKTSMIVVKSKLTIPEYGIILESFGGNDNGGEGSKNFDLGDAYKGATTDAFTKICSFLEIGMDVYKGASAPNGSNGNGSASTPAPTNGKTDERPWLNENTEAFTKAVDFLAKNGDIKKIEAKYRISKKIRELLITTAV